MRKWTNGIKILTNKCKQTRKSWKKEITDEFAFPFRNKKKKNQLLQEMKWNTWISEE